MSVRRPGTLFVGAAVLAALLSGCPGNSHMDPGPAPMIPLLSSISPTTVLPGSTVFVEGQNLSDDAENVLLLQGHVGGGRHLTQVVPIVVEDGRGRWVVDEQTFSAFGEGHFAGTVEVASRGRWSETTSPPMMVSLSFARQLTPSLAVVGDGVVFLNSKVPLEGAELLAGGSEGQAVAELDGCFVPEGVAATAAAAGGCTGAAVRASLPIELDDTARRQRGAFRFAPQIAGIRPGRFEGTVTIANHHANGTVLVSQPVPARFNLQATHFTGFGSSSISLGQYFEVQGQGFIEGTSLRFQGSFAGQSGSRPVQLEVVLGAHRGRFGVGVVDEHEGIGSAVNLRTEWGTLTGTWTPVTRFGADQVQGEPVIASLVIAPIKQVLWIRFTDGWYDALHAFGLQAADREIRERVRQIFVRDYAGVNVEVRFEEPEDFKLYARLDIVGRNPNNGIGLGLDATPGKDTNNQRLHDIVGGYNAETRVTPSAHSPGATLAPFGGVFAEAMLSFSMHPPVGVYPWPKMQSPLFDRIFDPVRPDRGTPATSTEVIAARNLPGTQMCPGSDRALQVGCAVRVLGNLIGHTAVHEFGHTLGLAKPDNPSTEDCHNDGSAPNRIMDSGSERPFEERAELMGQGPAVFCQDNFNYLQRILPPGAIDPSADFPRPSCY